MVKMANSGGERGAGSETQPLYYDMPRSLFYILRGLFILTVAMIVLSFIFCLAKGPGNKNLYLLACNLVISSFIGIVTTWWFRKGHLAPEKFWYVMLVAAVIIFQCITTDIYVFHQVPTIIVGPTLAPSINITTANH